MYIEVLKNGGGFKGLVEYNLKKDDPSQGEIIGGNVHASDPEFTWQQFHEIRQIRRDIEKPVLHTIMAWHPQDQVDNLTMESAAERVLDGIGFDRDAHQYLIVRHHDAGHHHLHIIGNRVAFDGSVFHGKFAGRKANGVRQDLEEEFGFTPGIPKEERQAIGGPSEPDPNLESYQGEGERAANNRRKYDERKLKKGVVGTMHEAVKSAIAQSNGTFDSLREILDKDAVVSASWSFNKAGFNGASFTLLSAYDPEEPERTPDGQTWTFNGKRIGWSRDKILTALEARQAALSGAENTEGRGAVPASDAHSDSAADRLRERLDRAQQWRAILQARAARRQAWRDGQAARAEARYSAQQRRESELLIRQLAGASSTPFGRHLGRLFRVKNPGYSKPRSPGVTRQMLRAFDVQVGLQPSRRPQQPTFRPQKRRGPGRGPGR